MKRFLFLLLGLVCGCSDAIKPPVAEAASLFLQADSLVDSVRVEVAGARATVAKGAYWCVGWASLPLPQQVHFRVWAAGTPDTGWAPTLQWRDVHGQNVRANAWFDGFFYWVALYQEAQPCVS